MASHYRLYPVLNGRVAGPPHIEECENDDGIYAKAVACLLLFSAKRCDTVEIWSGPRFVGLVRRDDVSAAPDQPAGDSLFP
jgi:hypothetical protein